MLRVEGISITSLKKIMVARNPEMTIFRLAASFLTSALQSIELPCFYPLLHRVGGLQNEFQQLWEVMWAMGR